MFHSPSQKAVLLPEYSISFNHPKQKPHGFVLECQFRKYYGICKNTPLITLNYREQNRHRSLDCLSIARAEGVKMGHIR